MPGENSTAPPFRDCVLHIGCEKTGTTSWQVFLDENAAALRALGWFVPAAAAPLAGRGVRNHVQLATACIEPATPELWQFAELAPPYDVPAHRRAVTAALAADISADAHGCPNLLLSSEHLSSRVRDVESVERLRALLTPLAERVRVLVYLRPQHEMAQALFATALRHGITEARPLPLFDGPAANDRVVGVDALYFDHLALLGRYAKVFGGKALLPRLFAPDVLAGGDVIEDMLAVLGIDGSFLLRQGRINRGFDADGQRFMLWLNRKLAAETIPDGDVLRAHVADALSARAAGPGIRPGHTETKAFLARFAAGNEAIRQHWFAPRPALFDIDLKPYPNRADPDTPVPPLVFERFADIVALLPPRWHPA